MYININDIVISDQYAESKPSPKKYDYKLSRYLKLLHYDPPILDDNNVLVDGYITYLILKNQGVDKVWVKDPVTYVFGKHLNSNSTKEYTWKVRPKKEIELGNITEGMTIMAFAGKNNDIAPIQVTKVTKLKVPPVTGRIKEVVGIANE